jgi:hypothetical protein
MINLFWKHKKYIAIFSIILFVLAFIGFYVEGRSILGSELSGSYVYNLNTEEGIAEDEVENLISGIDTSYNIYTLEEETFRIVFEEKPTADLDETFEEIIVENPPSEGYISVALMSDRLLSNVAMIAISIILIVSLYFLFTQKEEEIKIKDKLKYLLANFMQLILFLSLSSIILLILGLSGALSLNVWHIQILITFVFLQIIIPFVLWLDFSPRLEKVSNSSYTQLIKEYFESNQKIFSIIYIFVATLLISPLILIIGQSLFLGIVLIVVTIFSYISLFTIPNKYFYLDKPIDNLWKKIGDLRKEQ